MMWRRRLTSILKITIVKKQFSTASKVNESDISNIRNIGILAHIDAGR